MADQELKNPWTPPLLEAKKGKKVAVIGSGPAGLTAALRLAQWGYDVTVHEALPVAGGMMAVGIPEYRLPRDILNAEIDNVRRAGAKIVLNSRLGRDITVDQLLDRDGYSAVSWPLGRKRAVACAWKGETLPGVLGGTDFLRDVALHNPPDMTGKRVAVVGGGNTAIDAARTAMRLGAADVHWCTVVRAKRCPPRNWKWKKLSKRASPALFGQPHADRGQWQGGSIELVQQELGEFDTSARRRPKPIEAPSMSCRWMWSSPRLAEHRCGLRCRLRHHLPARYDSGSEQEPGYGACRRVCRGAMRCSVPPPW